MYPADLDTKDFDPELWEAVVKENQRQEDHIELIASENYVSPRVLQMQGSQLTNKYAEGYPHKRYYGGCEYVDIAEDLAIDRLKQLFGASYANVQPHSGSQANYAVYQALVKPGDNVVGMDLNSGGHLTHGCKVNFSGKNYNAFVYGLDDNGEIDYDTAAKLVKEHQPKLLVTGFSAYSGIVDWQRFRDIADSVGAYMMSDIAHVAGLIAAGVYPSPIDIADVTTSTTHKTLRGARGGVIMAGKRADDDFKKKLNSAIFPGSQGGPLMHVIAAKAVAFKEALQPEFKTYQEQVVKNAKAMAQATMERGYKVVSNGTHNHLYLMDLIDKDITGKDAENWLEDAFITVNKNTVPGDPRSAFVTSGLRIGSPACTTRGFKEDESIQVANWVCDVLDSKGDDAVIAKVREQVIALCQQFPVYG